MIREALPGFSGSLRRHLYRQAQRLAVMIESGGQPWTGDPSRISFEPTIDAARHSATPTTAGGEQQRQNEQRRQADHQHLPPTAGAVPSGVEGIERRRWSCPYRTSATARSTPPQCRLGRR